MMYFSTPVKILLIISSLSALSSTIHIYQVKTYDMLWLSRIVWNSISWFLHLICKEYPCSCNTCLRFDFKECSGDGIPVYAELPCNDYSDDDEEVDAIDKTEHIFDFLDVPSFVSLFIGNDEKFLNFWFKKLILICSFLLTAISILLVEYFMLKGY